MLGNRGIQEDVLRSDFVGHIRGDKTILLSEYRKSQDSVSGKDEVFVDCKKDAAFCYNIFIGLILKAFYSLLEYIHKLMAN